MKRIPFCKKAVTLRVCDLLKPEYHKKNPIEGRRSEVLKGLRKNDVISPIHVNMKVGRKYRVINGYSIVEMWRELNILEIPALIYFVPLDVEKELHFLLNTQTSANTKETIKALLMQKYEDYFPDEQIIKNPDNQDFCKLPNRPKTAMNDRLKPITSHLNMDEEKIFNKVKQHFNCETNSEVVRQLLKYFVDKEGDNVK